MTVDPPSLAVLAERVGASLRSRRETVAVVESSAGALVSASLGRASRAAFIIGSLAFNGAVLLIAPLKSEAAAGVLLLVAGSGFSVWLASGQSILQLTSPDKLRGRVISVVPAAAE